MKIRKYLQKEFNKPVMVLQALNIESMPFNDMRMEMRRSISTPVLKPSGRACLLLSSLSYTAVDSFPVNYLLLGKLVVD